MRKTIQAAADVFLATTCPKSFLSITMTILFEVEVHTVMGCIGLVGFDGDGSSRQNHATSAATCRYVSLSRHINATWNYVGVESLLLTLPPFLAYTLSRHITVFAFCCERESERMSHQVIACGRCRYL